MRSCLLLAVFAAALAGADSETVRGKLTQRPGQPPALETDAHRFIALDGDQPTRGVLNDKRLNGFEMQAKGHFTAPDRFLIDGVHLRSVLVHSQGHWKYVTYWCDLCSLRTYTPGLCWCCQKETTLDLRDPDEP